MRTGDKERFDRQLHIAGWRQDRLSGSHVMVIGAGALGNEVVKNLALTGIGNVLIVDFDRIETSNLSRTVLFSESDVGNHKAETLARACKRLYPAINVSYINGDIMYDIGLGFYREADLVIGCLDNIAARSQASTCAALAGTPYLDTGVWSYGGELKWFFPENSACFECSMSEKDKTDIVTRYSCTGFKAAGNRNVNINIPTTLAPAAIIGGMAVQEVCHYLSGTRVISPGHAIVYNGLEPSLHISLLPLEPSCRNHENGPYENIIKLPCSAADTSVMKILEIAAETLGEDVTLELGRDFLSGLYCRRCDEYEIVNQPISRVTEEKSFCPACKKKRERNVITSLMMKDAASTEMLITLGISRGDILLIHSPAGMGFYQLDADVQATVHRQSSHCQ